MIELTDTPIDFTALTDSVRSTKAGAVVLFMGTVREITGDVRTSSLYYEAFTEMAIQCMQKLEQDAREKYSVTDIAISHRTGQLLPGDISVAIAVSSPHRAAAFEAGRWLIDTLKEQVPVWKQEQSPDGRTEWVHPGVPSASVSPTSDGPCAPGMSLP